VESEPISESIFFDVWNIFFWDVDLNLWVWPAVWDLAGFGDDSGVFCKSSKVIRETCTIFSSNTDIWVLDVSTERWGNIEPDVFRNDVVSIN
jgi:hypothetical protein